MSVTGNIQYPNPRKQVSMDVKTYRAKTFQDALQMVQSDLGPDASILQTRQLRSGLVRWLRNTPQVEVTASATIPVPRRLHEGLAADVDSAACSLEDSVSIPSADRFNYRAQYRSNLYNHGNSGTSLVEELCGHQATSSGQHLPETLVQLLGELLDAEVNEEDRVVITGGIVITAVVVKGKVVAAIAGGAASGVAGAITTGIWNWFG